MRLLAAVALCVAVLACEELTEADQGFFGARTDGFVWTASSIEVRRSGGLLTIEASEDETLTGMTLTLPESLGRHSLDATSEVRLTYEVPGSSWSASAGGQGTASVNVTALSADGIVGTFTGEVFADGSQARAMVTISQGVFDIRF